MAPNRLYLDTNIFIYAFETKAERYLVAWRLLTAVERGDLVGITSEITLAELLVRPLRERNLQLVEVYSDLIRVGGPLTTIPVDREVLRRAAAARAANLSLKLPDALHVATAAICEASHFASFDRTVPLDPSMTRIDGTVESIETLLGAAP